MASREDFTAILPAGLDEDLQEYICGALEDEDAFENAEDLEELVSSVLVDADLATEEEAAAIVQKLWAVLRGGAAPEPKAVRPRPRSTARPQGAGLGAAFARLRERERARARGVHRRR